MKYKEWLINTICIFLPIILLGVMLPLHLLWDVDKFTFSEKLELMVFLVPVFALILGLPLSLLLLKMFDEL